MGHDDQTDEVSFFYSREGTSILARAKGFHIALISFESKK